MTTTCLIGVLVDEKLGGPLLSSLSAKLGVAAPMASKLLAASTASIRAPGCNVLGCHRLFLVKIVGIRAGASAARSACRGVTRSPPSTHASAIVRGFPSPRLFPLGKRRRVERNRRSLRFFVGEITFATLRATRWRLSQNGNARPLHLRSTAPYEWRRTSCRWPPRPPCASPRAWRLPPHRSPRRARLSPRRSKTRPSAIAPT